MICHPSQFINSKNIPFRTTDSIRLVKLYKNLILNIFSKNNQLLVNEFMHYLNSCKIVIKCKRITEKHEIKWKSPGIHIFLYLSEVKHRLDLIFRRIDKNRLHSIISLSPLLSTPTIPITQTISILRVSSVTE